VDHRPSRELADHWLEEADRHAADGAIVPAELLLRRLVQRAYRDVAGLADPSDAEGTR
jgi:hypothetical protein